ncbi:MAG TPA: DUF503 domain-containing protein [Acidimicrobiales bacterium]|nr:DUF503 domain-containing protein [Acidimicrobiales bacterium]
MDLRLRDVHSLKEKRSVVKPIVEGAHRRFAVASAEVDHHDSLRQATLGMACVSSDASHASRVIDAVERFVWSFPEVEVISCRREWMR